LGVVIHGNTRIGAHSVIYQNVTIGGDGRGPRPTGGAPSVPVIEERVVIYAGAVVVGPITIGEGAVIGANAVVLQSVAPHTTVVGVPARTLETRGQK
jgi:serine O-acetyltransferase